MYFVSYRNRARHEHYTAAQFDAAYCTYDDVVAWVNKHPKLLLITKGNYIDDSLYYLS